MRETRLSVQRAGPAGDPAAKTRGILRAGPLSFPVALGRPASWPTSARATAEPRAGLSGCKRLWWRADRLTRPRTALPVRRSAATTPGARTPPTAATIVRSAASRANAGDRLMRDDHLYDFIIEIDHNTRPRIAGRGSAVFVHVARAGFAPTAGCVALAGESALRRLSCAARAEARKISDRLGLPTVGRSPKIAAADAHMRRAERDRDREIRAHAHRQKLEPVARGDFRGERKMRRRRLVERRNAHQPVDRQPVIVRQLAQERVGILRQHAGLLRLGAGIDLDKQQRRARSCFGDFLRQRLARGSAGRANGWRRTARPPPSPCSIAAARSDAARCPDACAFSAGHLALRFLHAVFAEHALAGRDHLLDRLGAEGLRHRDQRHAGGIALGLAAGGRDLGRTAARWEAMLIDGLSMHLGCPARGRKDKGSMAEKPGAGAGLFRGIACCQAACLPLRLRIPGRFLSDAHGRRRVPPKSSGIRWCLPSADVGFRELDLVRPFHVIDGADMRARPSPARPCVRGC